MAEAAVGYMDRNSNNPAPRGERVAAYVERYLERHRGLSLGELAFRLPADKRDIQRLVRDRSCGSRLEDALAAYFGRDFVDAIFAPVVGDGPSRRERELEQEIAEMAAKRERLERERRDARCAEAGAVLRMVGDENRGRAL